MGGFLGKQEISVAPGRKSVSGQRGGAKRYEKSSPEYVSNRVMRYLVWIIRGVFNLSLVGFPQNENRAWNLFIKAAGGAVQVTLYFRLVGGKKRRGTNPVS